MFEAFVILQWIKFYTTDNALHSVDYSVSDPGFPRCGRQHLLKKIGPRASKILLCRSATANYLVGLNRVVILMIIDKKRLAETKDTHLQLKIEKELKSQVTDRGILKCLYNRICTLSCFFDATGSRTSFIKIVK